MNSYIPQSQTSNPRSHHQRNRHHQSQRTRSRCHREWLRVLRAKRGHADVRPSETCKVKKDGLRVLDLNTGDLDRLWLRRQLRWRRDSKHRRGGGRALWHGGFQKDGIFGRESWDDDVVRYGLDLEAGFHKRRVSIWACGEGCRPEFLRACEE